MAARIQVDRSACRGSGACARRAPRTFALDPERKSHVVDPRGDEPATIREAANACPFFAIEVVDASGEGPRSDPPP